MDFDEIVELMQPGPTAYERDLVAALRRRPAWHADAACRGMSVETFFPPRGSSVEPAKAVCATCPVRDECDQFAEADWHARRIGVWGGRSARDRRQARQGRAA